MTVATQTIAIQSIDTRPQRDPYTGGETRTTLQLDPESRVIQVYQRERSNSTPAYIYHLHVIEWTLSGHPKEEWVESWIYDNMELLQRVADGHSIEWDGSNQVGKLTPGAMEARASIDFMVYHGILDEYYELWSMEEWLEAVEDETVTLTDDEIRELVDECMLPNDKWQLLDFDAEAAFEYLKTYRDQNQEDE